MHLSCIMLIAIGMSLVNCFPTSDADEFVERDSAFEFLNENSRDLEIVKRLLYTGKEQRREAKENYEEKCERNVINQALHKQRWCPELETWPAWVEATKNDRSTKNKLIG